MPARHLEELVKRLHPGVSTRQLELRAGLHEGYIAYFFKPSTEINSIPHAYKVVAIADALGCAPVDVTMAFAMDAKLPLSRVDLSPDELDLIDAYRGLTTQHQATLRQHLSPDMLELVESYGGLNKRNQYTVRQMVAVLQEGHDQQ